jgi:hypothetical protein
MYAPSIGYKSERILQDISKLEISCRKKSATISKLLKKTSSPCRAPILRSTLGFPAVTNPGRETDGRTYRFRGNRKVAIPRSFGRF